MQGARLTTKSERDALARKIQGKMNDFACNTPGLRLRSGGRGRGLARGRGYGPLGGRGRGRGRGFWDW